MGNSNQFVNTTTPSEVGSKQAKEQYEAFGYVVVRGLLEYQRDITPVIREYDELLSGICDGLYERGMITARHEGLDFEHKALTVSAQVGVQSIYDYFRIFLNPPGRQVMGAGTEKDSPLHVGPAVFGLLCNEKLLDAIATIIGDEIYFNPVGIVRLKPPERLVMSDELKEGPNYRASGAIASQFWHQDQAVFSKDVGDVNMVTAWVSLTDATTDMGCLMVCPGSHKKGIAVHCETNANPGIPPQDLGETKVPLETRAGDVILMNKLLKHGSLPNTSDRLRFSLDLRYQPNGESIGRKFIGSEGFVVRSNKNPEQILKTNLEWAALQKNNKEYMMQIDPENEPSIKNHFQKHEWCF